jgi:anti-sigma regulatory factor (Ser/Thr protein kinase)
MTQTVSSRAGPFVHPALFYASDEEYLDGLVPFVIDGLALGQPVAVAVPNARLGILRMALGTAAELVTMIDMAVAGRNPGRIIAGVLRRFADRYPQQHVRIVGEPIWPGRTATEYPACVQHEALINAAFAGRHVTIVCPYDTAGLSPVAIADARATHPLLWAADGHYASDSYSPDTVLDRYNQPLTRGSHDVIVTIHSVAELPGARFYAAEQGRRLGLGVAQVPDLELILTELVTNSLVHTGDGCHVQIWREQEHLICEIRDSGQLTDPLAGRGPSQPQQHSGRGLLLVNDLADLVRTHTSPHGTTMRALLRIKQD